MKVYIGKPKRFFGPYQLAELLCFWAMTKDEYGMPERPEWVCKFGEFLYHGSIEPGVDYGKLEVGEIYSIGRWDRKKTFLAKFLHWIDDNNKRKVKVKIHSYDSWEGAENLGYIILPLLKEVKKKKYGSPFVDPEDVPEHLRPENEEVDPYGTVDDKFHARWDWVIDEIIYAFEHVAGDKTDWEDQFYTKKDKDKPNFQMQKTEDGAKLVSNTNVDLDGMKEYQKRIDNGFRLFGKYYQSLWV